jgi:hypothetical protein
LSIPQVPIVGNGQRIKLFGREWVCVMVRFSCPDSPVWSLETKRGLIQCDVAKCS